MKILTYLFVLLLVEAGCSRAVAQLSYPETVKSQRTDRYFGNDVPDHYRWLENTGSSEVRGWIDRQNAFTRDYLSGIDFRPALLKKLETLQNFTRYEKPFIKGDYYYFYKNEGLQDHFILYRQKGLKAPEEIFLDPGSFKGNETKALQELSLSKDGKYCAYVVNDAASGRSEVNLMETASKKRLGDAVAGKKLSGISWYRDEGFYYSGFADTGSTARQSPLQLHSLYYHKVGTPTSADLLVYQDSMNAERLHYGKVTEDDHFLILTISEGTENTQIMLRDLRAGKNAPFKMILEGFQHQAEVVDNDNKFLYLRTNVSAPNFRVVAANIVNPYVNNWETMVAERKELLQSVKKSGGEWFGTYLHDARSRLIHYTSGGYMIREVDVPDFTTVDVSDGNSGDREMIYTYTSFSQPPVVCLYRIGNGKTSIFKSGSYSFNPADFETKQVFYTNRDHIKIPMFISYKKGTNINENTPCLLFGYGGFNEAQTPRFNIAHLFFMSQGGVFAVANIRGGSEYGEAWHKAGMLFRKQNVINDFVDAASFLFKEKYTNSNKLAIKGIGAGGLLAGASMVQKPKMFKVVLPVSGLFDLLRYQKFAVGQTWKAEYGSSDDVEQFDNLYAYSPLHNIKPGTIYPATFITADENDGLTSPLHSYKFAARLQESQAGTNPILLRVDRKATAGLYGKQTQLKLEEMADVLSFTMKNLGMDFR